METINIAPTWKGITPTLIFLLTEGNAEARRTARDELLKMATAADLYNGEKP